MDSRAAAPENCDYGGLMLHNKDVEKQLMLISRFVPASWVHKSFNSECETNLSISPCEWTSHVLRGEALHYAHIAAMQSQLNVTLSHKP